MLRLAEVGPADTVYDLGSGDGRIVLAAARDFGARAVGIEIDAELVARSRAHAREAGLAERVEIRHGDLFRAELGEATVVALYLLPTVNRRLRPALLDGLAPGSRVVSHRWGMGDWKPDAETRVSLARGGPPARVAAWVVPAAAGGTWEMTVAERADRDVWPSGWTARLWQRYQELDALLVPVRARPGRAAPAWRRLRAGGRLVGREFELSADASGSEPIVLRGTVEGDRLVGTLETPGNDGRPETVEVVGRRRPWRLEGVWRWEDGAGRTELTLQRRDGVLVPELRRTGAREAPSEVTVAAFHAWGAAFYLRLAGDDGSEIYTALVDGDRLSGTRRDEELVVRPWRARRASPVVPHPPGDGDDASSGASPVASAGTVASPISAKSSGASGTADLSQAAKIDEDTAAAATRATMSPYSPG